MDRETIGVKDDAALPCAGIVSFIGGEEIIIINLGCCN